MGHDVLANLVMGRTSPLPLHVQLADGVKARIEDGSWAPGERLPTVRDLAAALGLNYNTVRAVYRDLEREGYVAARQGRGTVVAARPPRLPEGCPDPGDEDIPDLIDAAARAARAADVPAGMAARALQAAYARAADASAGVRLLFVECNAPDLEHHAAEIGRGVGVQPDTATIADLRRSDAPTYARADLVATTLFHVAEVRELLGPGRPVLGLPVTPSYERVIRPLSQAPRGAPVGLVCATREGARGMERMLAGVGLGHVRYATAGLDRPGEVEEVFDRAGDVYVSRMGLRARRGRWPREAAPRAYVTELDASGLRLLRRAVAARDTGTPR